MRVRRCIDKSLVESYLVLFGICIQEPSAPVDKLDCERVWDGFQFFKALVPLVKALDLSI